MIAWLHRRRARRDCFHHNHNASGESWISGRLIDLGRRKMFKCSRCNQEWFT